MLKAWHGRKPVFRNDQDWFALDTATWELRSIIAQLNLRKIERPSAPSRPTIAPVADDVPLTELEVRSALAVATRNNLSMARRIAAVLDVLGVPTDTDTLATRLREWDSDYASVNLADVQRGSKSGVQLREDNLLQIDLASPHLQPVRRAVRKLAERTLLRAAIEEQSKLRYKAYETQQAERQVRDRNVAQQLRRAIVRIVPDTEAPAAAAILDVKTRTIRTFVGPELSALPQVLADYDYVAGLWIRESLYAIDVKDHDQWILADLQPPQKTLQLNRSGRKLLITPELLLSSTTGISRPLGDAAKIAEYLAMANSTKLRRRLESDLKSLYAFYNYGILHRVVRLRWGFLNESFSAAWAHPGDPTLHEICRECQQNGSLVEIVCGSAPGWTDPWSRAKRVKIVATDYSTVLVEGHERTWIPRDEIQAIRILA